MEFYFEYLINWLSRPKTIKGIAKKIILSIKHFTIKCCVDHKFQRQIDFDKMDEDGQADVMREMTVNAICFTILSFQGLAEISKFPAYSEFYSLTALEVRSCYGNYLKAKNTDLETVNRWNDNITQRLDDFKIVFKKNQKDLKPMPEGNPWVFISIVTMMSYLRGKKVLKTDPLFYSFVAWNAKIENENFKILKTAQR